MVTTGPPPADPDRSCDRNDSSAVRTAAGTGLDARPGMRTVQISMGEILEAMYADLMETYGDKELALSAAQAVSDELLAQVTERARPVRRAERCLPAGLAKLSATVTRQVTARRR